MRVSVAVGLFVILAACVQVGPVGTPAANTNASPSADSGSSAASAPRISPPPVTPPVAPGTNLPAFACADAAGGTTGAANVTAVRVSEPGAFDRFVLQFDAAVPKYTVKRQDKPTFPMGTSRVTLSGTAGALVTVSSAAESASYTGSTDMSHAEFLVIKEARLTQDLGGSVSWALGLDHPACMRAFTLTNPSRLIVDFTTATG